METFVVNELVRQASRIAGQVGVTLYHYRAHTGTEIDIIAEADDGRVVGVEVKAGASVDAGDFSHLAAVRDRLDELSDLTFVRGVVLYAGRREERFGDRLLASPIASLWLPTRKR